MGKTGHSFSDVSNYSGTALPNKLTTNYQELLVYFSSDTKREGRGFRISIDFLLKGMFISISICNQRVSSDNDRKFPTIFHKPHFSEGICPTNYFVCANDQCLEPGKICDGINDCGDNSDESTICTGRYLC